MNQAIGAADFGRLHSAVRELMGRRTFLLIHIASRPGKNEHGETPLSYADIAKICATSKSNAIHIAKSLVEDGLIKKVFSNGRAVNLWRLTRNGRWLIKLLREIIPIEAG